MVAARGLAIVLATLVFLTGPGINPARADAGAVTARDGRLTVKVDAMPADQLLAEIARQTGIRITPIPAAPEWLVTELRGRGDRVGARSRADEL